MARREAGQGGTIRDGLEQEMDFGDDTGDTDNFERELARALADFDDYVV